MTDASQRKAIVVDGLSKQYSLSLDRAATLREAIATTASRLLRPNLEREGAKRQRDAFWALNDISFDVDHGEIVGVIGNNGAGKSTLLKILSRITLPSRGSVRLWGKVGALLEVGTGFHPELSGRDNVFLNGILLGMNRRDIARRFDEIVAFAEIGPFIDIPVKRYSSGMYVRLAFAVAAYLESDILLVDEVLAVGDVAFQRKCLSRMGEIAHAGRTILFISHNLTAIQALCPRTIWIDNGVITADGETREVLSRYLRASDSSGSSRERNWQGGRGPAAGGIEVRYAAAYPIGETPSAPIDVETTFRLEFKFAVSVTTVPTHLSLQLVDEQGVLIFDVGTGEKRAPWAQGLHTVQCEIPRHFLNDGLYRFNLLLYQEGKPILHLSDIVGIDVLDSGAQRSGWFGKWPGVLRPKLHWERTIQEG
jgi:lipopolysaccharide transport system ATP-binding protein